MKFPFFSLRGFCALFLMLGLSAGVFAGGKQADSAKNEGPLVVASTSWVAAIARAGGAENVRILAPLELRHPPEYELKPSDLDLASKADVILYAGWEMFAKKLAETAGSAGVKTMLVTTTNSPEDVKTEAAKIADLLGTRDKFETWNLGFDSFIADIKTQVLAAYPDNRAVVQRMQLPFIQWLGFSVAGEYGPAEPSPALILELVNTRPVLVIDNYHGPSGMPIAEAARVPYAELINFPGKDGTKTIEDVFAYNARILIEAAKK
jgi:zinc transport system substrate-binding protein/iron/zinc/copper transport system substrate-binding protein